MTTHYANLNRLLRLKLTTPCHRKPSRASHFRPQTLHGTSFSAKENHSATPPPLKPLTKTAQNLRSFFNYRSRVSHNDRIDGVQQHPLEEEEEEVVEIVSCDEQINENNNNKKNFWAAVSLIIGTAVGPGMLGLPAATIKSGPIPSTLAIILSWVYVISSIVLIAELSFASMEENRVTEISFTGLAINTFGKKIGACIALVYASLSFSLMVACVSGIGSIISQVFPSLNVMIAHALFPSIVGTLILFFPFQAIDTANRMLCSVMLFFITALVSVGSVTIFRTNSLTGSLRFASHASWQLSSILPAVPVAALTLGFHVITPFICKIAGDTVHEARKAVLIGGTVPLVMVLSWNLIVLGLAAGAGGGTGNMMVGDDPISLLLSVESSALFAVRGFAFSALATSLIGYAISFPKQLIDTLELITTVGRQRSVDDDDERSVPTMIMCTDNDEGSGSNVIGIVGFGSHEDGKVGNSLGNVGKVVFHGSSGRSGSSRSRSSSSSRIVSDPTRDKSSFMSGIVLVVVLLVPVIVASFYQSTFTKALDFAGVYANCFLFGILPPLMAYIYKHKKKRLRSSALPGGDVALFLLFIIAVILAIWH